MSEQFSRTELLIGKEGIEKLSKSRVAVFGIGGVGADASFEIFAGHAVFGFLVVEVTLVGEGCGIVRGDVDALSRVEQVTTCYPEGGREGDSPKIFLEFHVLKNNITVTKNS